jgi:hypothetical protein
MLNATSSLRNGNATHEGFECFYGRLPEAGIDYDATGRGSSRSAMSRRARA